MSLAETIHVGQAIQIRLIKTDEGHAVLSVFAPRSLSINRDKNFSHPTNDDGPGVRAPEPSAKKSVIDQDSGDTHGE